jgi:nucleotide-binding universal stress UspA family protein
MSSGRIVVGVDGSQESRQATNWAVGRAAESGSELILVHALGADVQFLRDLPPTGFSNWRSHDRISMQREWSQPARDAHVRYRTFVLDADPVVALTTVAAAQHADIIAVGGPSKGELTDRVLGSFTHRLLHHAHHPVVIIPKDWSAVATGLEPVATVTD